MKIRTIRVGASMTVPSKTVPFANVKPSVEIEVELSEGEDKDAVIVQLQHWCREAISDAIPPLESLHG